MAKTNKLHAIIQHLNLHFLLITTLWGVLVTSKVPAVIVFGDSTVDTGNNNGIKTLLKSNFFPYGRDFYGSRPTGRFCNGRISPDFIAEYFGLKTTIPAYLDPSYGIEDFATGVVFASAGTGFDNTTATVLNVIPFWKQIDFFKDYQKRLRAYLGVSKANETVYESVYIVSIGTNDFLENYYLLPTTRAHFTIHEFEDHLVEIATNFFTEIYRLGARKVSFTGLSPIGCLPLERTVNIFEGNRCNEDYNNVALEFNVKLKAMVNKLNHDLPGFRLAFSNPYYLVRQMIRKPWLFGFDEVSRACCGTGLLEMSYLCKLDSSLTCSDANKYLFWDSFHPTEKTNRIVTDYVIKKILYKFHN